MRSAMRRPECAPAKRSLIMLAIIGDNYPYLVAVCIVLFMVVVMALTAEDIVVRRK
jgi:hypothetical protein